MGVVGFWGLWRWGGGFVDDARCGGGTACARACGSKEEHHLLMGDVGVWEGRRWGGGFVEEARCGGGTACARACGSKEEHHFLWPGRGLGEGGVGLGVRGWQGWGEVWVRDRQGGLSYREPAAARKKSFY
jgi:hypothetical protein